MQIIFQVILSDSRFFTQLLSSPMMLLHTSMCDMQSQVNKINAPESIQHQRNSVPYYTILFQGLIRKCIELLLLIYGNVSLIQKNAYRKNVHFTN